MLRIKLTLQHRRSFSYKERSRDFNILIDFLLKLLGQGFYALSLYLFLKNWSIPQHISLCPVKIHFSTVIDKTRTPQCHSFAKNQIEYLLQERTAHFTSYIFQEMLINIKTCNCYSSINHQEHLSHRTLYHQLLLSDEYCKILKKSFFIEHLQKQWFADVLQNSCS